MKAARGAADVPHVKTAMKSEQAWPRMASAQLSTELLLSCAMESVIPKDRPIG